MKIRNIKTIFFFAALNSLFIGLQAQNFEWTKREGQGAYDYGYGIANDNSGNVYVAGKYEMNANFSGTILPMQGNHDIYVAKYSSTGALIWIRTAGGVSGDYAHALACDGANFVYVAGEIEGSGTTINFLGSSNTLTCRGVNDAFFAKYDLNGNLIWANQIGGNSNDEALGITYDNADNVYICGFFNGSATFGTTTVTGHGLNDIYVAKYDKNGVFQWVRTAGGVGRDEAKGIKCDAAGNVYICGLYKDAAVFGSQTLTSPNGYFNSFLAKYTSDGTLAWVKTAGGDYDDVGWALTVDNNNKIYVTGEFNAYAHFDGIAIPTTGSADIFVACYDASGNIQWVKKAGGPLLDRARGIGCDGTNIYITGQYSLSASFDSYTITGADSSEIFIAKINNAGSFQWAASVGGPADSYEKLGYESGDAICAEASGNVYSTGALLNGGLFGSTSFNTYGRTDAFISKMSQNIVPPNSSEPLSLTVMLGQPASFNVTATGSLPISYQWQKNGLNISGASTAVYSIPSAQFTDAGQYRMIVNNIYGSDTSNAATLSVITTNAPPKATILSPSNGTFYHAGDAISFSGSAIDPEDGNLSASAFSWSVYFHNNTNNFIPGPIISAGIASGSFVIPKTGEPSANVFYRLKLKVTDSNGLIDTAYVDILPLTSSISINTQPSGLQITFNNQPKTTPFSTLTVEGMLIPIGVVSPQNSGSQNYTFSNWQHGGSASQTILAGAGDSSYTAVFNTSISACTASGSITREFWANVTGPSVASVPVNTVPTSTSQLTIFEGPSQNGDNYGSRISGFICPPLTGNYIFWIASDNNSELWLSTNDQISNKVKIAFVTGYTGTRAWTKYPSQQSVPISLLAGVKYYIEAIHKEGTQGDNLSVGWQLPNGILERPIPGSRLSPYTTSGTNLPVVTITNPANSSTYPSPANITINATATSSGGAIVKVEFYQGTTKIGEDLTAPYSFTWMNITTGNYALKAIATDNTNHSGTSQIVNISITTCSTPKITPSGPTTMCSGSVTLQSNSGSGFIYQWQKDGLNITGAISSTYIATVSGSYQIKIIQGSCISWSAPVKVRIQSGLISSITPGGPLTFCLGGNVKLYGSTCSGYTYQWKKDGSNISGATGSTYTAAISGNYQLQVTLAGVNAWSSLVTLTVNNCRESEMSQNDETNQVQNNPDITNSKNIFQMKVFPNPNTGMFTIALNMALIEGEKVKMRIVNILGQEVYKKESVIKDNYFKEIVELDKSLPTGIYTLQVIIGNKVENTSVVLAR